MLIHHTVIIEGNVNIAEDVEIGAYSIIKGNINIKKGTRIKPHVYIEGDVDIGENNIIYSFSSIGTAPQDDKFKNEKSYVKIGNNNIIREHVTINGGSELGNQFKNIKNGTIIEDNCYLMINSHIGHDCYLESGVIITNNVLIAGHCLIEKKTIIGGGSCLHQFIRIGAYSMIGGMCGIGESVPPYSIIFRESDKLSGLNIVGLKRNNISSEEIKIIKDFYNELFDKDKIKLDILDKIEQNPRRILTLIRDFFQNLGRRGLILVSDRIKEKGF